MKIPSKAILFISGIIALIVLVFSFLPGQKETIENEKLTEVNYEKLDDVVFNVKVKNVIEGDLIKSVSANGLVKAYKELDVISNISGYIDKIYIYEGKQVKQGDLLLKFDDREQRIALSEAEMKLMNAKIEYGFLRKEKSNEVDERAVDSIKSELEKLDVHFKDKLLTEEQYINRKEELDLALIFTGAKRNEVLLNKSGMTSAINQLNMAKLNFNYTEITAPFDGVIGDFKLEVKQRINSGEKLFKMLDVSKYKVEVGILENEIPLIKVGNRAEIKINAIPGKTYFGRVIFINPLIEEETKTCRVTVEFPNTDQSIKPGMFATVKIESSILKNRVLIPKEALLVRDRRDLVFVAEEDIAKWKYIQIGEQNENFIEILDGVKPGEKVIVDGHYNLAHDSRIRILNE